MDQATQFVQSNSSILTTVAFLAVIIAILYVVYTYLYPADDPTYTRFLKGEADARKPVNMHKTKVPAIYTGGDFTLSFWVYIDDWNYKVSSSKFLFAISPQTVTTTSVSPLVGVLTPLQNGLMVRASSVNSKSVPAPGSIPAATGVATPDITVETNLQSLLNQQSSMSMFQSTVDTPCDVKEVPLQRWVCITIVSSGRVLDVYMDGKLSRSCVLDNVLSVPRGPLRLRLGENGGFGGRYSSVQMWNQQLTPDVIYGIYQMGPTQAQHDIFTEIAKYLNLNVSFTGSAPGQPIPTAGGGNPFQQLSSEVGSVYGAASADASAAYGATTGEGQALMARF
jgi:hypothetical protein